MFSASVGMRWCFAIFAARRDCAFDLPGSEASLRLRPSAVAPPLMVAAGKVGAPDLRPSPMHRPNRNDRRTGHERTSIHARKRRARTIEPVWYRPTAAAISALPTDTATAGGVMFGLAGISVSSNNRNTSIRP
uniref:Uncharacterized protein n=1 Tax=Anopheles melas TaxID=34690 RepID=A0A182UJB9_9DIPT